MAHCLGQQCINRYRAATYRGTNYYNFTASVETLESELVTGGNVRNDHAYIARLTTNGTVLFTYQYTPVYQNNRVYYVKLKINAVTNSRDGGQLVGATVLQDKYIYQNEYFNDLGVIFKIDRYGKVLWSKKFEGGNAAHNSGFNLSVVNVLERANNDIILFLASDYGKNYNSYGKVVCMDGTGNVKWSTCLANGYDGSFEGKRTILETKDQSIMIGELLHLADRQQAGMPITKSFLHVLQLNKNGNIRWEKAFEIPLSSFSPTLEEMHETNQGEFILTGSLPLSVTPGAQPQERAFRMRFNSQGNLLTTQAFEYASETHLKGVTSEASGSQSYLLQSQNKTTLIGLNEKGEVLWTQGINDAIDHFPVGAISKKQNGYALFLSGFESLYTRILFTDEKGYIPCANEIANVTVTETTLPSYSITSHPEDPDPNPFYISDFPLRIDPFPLTNTIDCEENYNCCQNTVDSGSHSITICEGEHYALPGGHTVTETGTYFEKLIAKAGCDSVIFYQVNVIKSPAHLTLGDDICFQNKDTAVLRATPGYDHYQWNNNSPASDSIYTIKKAGIYWVQVENICGHNIDSIIVYNDCNFSVHMPNAFTPGNDGRNDVFRLPPGSKNRFISLSIYNRWGKLVFQTTDPNKEWDGSSENKLLPSGVYVYLLQLKGLSGDPMQQNGTVLLIR